MKRFGSLLLLLVFVVLHTIAMAQSSWLFGTDYDMPNSLVNDIAIDANQMVWVATEDGLCKYDGFSFTTYRNVPDDPHSLQANYVRRLYCDKSGHLLVGTRSGLQVYRPESDNFSLLANYENGSLATGDVAGFLELRNGEIWVCGNTTCGLRFDEDDKPVLYRTVLTDQLDYTEDIVEDSLGYVWAIRRLQELYRVSPSGDVECIRHHGADVSANALFCGSDGNIYIGMNIVGLHRFNTRTQEIELVDDSKCLVREMGHLHDGRMYVATDNLGLMIYDYATERLSPFEYRSEILEPATQKVHAACEDGEHNIWMALYQRGVMVVPEHSLPFHLIGQRSRQFNVIGDKCVTSMYLDRDRILWISTDNGGLYAITCDGRLVSHFDCHGENATSPFALMCVFEDSQRRLWYSSYNQGFGWVNRKTGSFNPLAVSGVRKASADIYDFAEDKYNRVWAASMGTGLLLFDEKSRTMSPAVHSDSCRWNNTICYDEGRNRMYVGSYNGLTVVDVDDPETNPVQCLQSDIVFDVLQINRDSLCLCTGDGIILFNLETFDYERYNTVHGLLAGNYYSALPDTLGNVWLGSNVGLTCFNLRSHIATNYTVFDGLQSNEFSKNATVVCYEGNLWFGGSGGISWFNPAEVSSHSTQCEVRIIDVIAGGNPAVGKSEFQSDDNTLVISMGLQPLTYARQAIYSYHLDDDAWTALPMGVNTVSFSHLASGKHQLAYKAVLDGYESEVQVFSFFIQYPWYYRWWAWLLWISLVAVLLLFIAEHIRQRKTENQREMRQRQQQEVSEAKLQFFTNIAHEIRTPMTLVVGPLMKLIKGDSNAERQHSYQLMLRNSNRILSLMNQLLDVRKLENSQMELRCQEIMMGEMTTDLCQSFEDVASLRKISLSIDNRLPAGQLLWVDKQQYEKILSNLLSNAMKFTPEGGSIEVTIDNGRPTEQYPEGYVKVVVADTGVGIPLESKSMVFDRFYQDKNGKTSHVGTGIGLYLTRQLMELHHGEIQATDNPAGKGTCMILFFHKGTSHLEKKQMLTAEEIGEIEDNEMAPKRIAQAILSKGEETPKEKVRRRSHKQKTILLIEDENEVREYLQNDLSPYYKVYVAENGVEGLAELKKHMPDIIISDVMMPEMDGIEFVNQVRQNPRYNQVRIIMLTAKIRDEEKIEGIEVGADAYITKPYNMDVLIATINNLITSQDRVRTAHNLLPMGSEQVETPEVVNPDTQMLEKVVRIINRNISNSSLTTEAIAQEVGMSRVHLFRKIKDLTGQSPSVYLRNIRLSKAAEIIAAGEATMSDVALAVGFENQGAFSSAFKDLFGMSPTQYKQLHRNPH